MSSGVTADMVRRAVEELHGDHPEWQLNEKLCHYWADDTVMWWWRRVSKIDIPTYEPLRVAVLSQRLFR